MFYLFIEQDVENTMDYIECECNIFVLTSGSVSLANSLCLAFWDFLSNNIISKMYISYKYCPAMH